VQGLYTTTLYADFDRYELSFLDGDLGGFLLLVLTREKKHIHEWVDIPKASSWKLARTRGAF
jgi:hypothetical protein